MAAGPVIFTDLDGTLLDKRTYSPALARESLARVLSAGIPVVFCSSKTRAEQAVLRTRLNVHDPFIVENGSAVIIPGDTQSGSGRGRGLSEQVITLGTPAALVRSGLERIRRESSLRFEGYGDLTVAEVARYTGLDPEAASLAMKREYSETIVTQLDRAEYEEFETRLAEVGLKAFSGGRFVTVTGAKADKGRAVRVLIDLFRREVGPVMTVGIGDSPNDTPLLEAVDKAYLVQQPEGDWLDVGVPGLERIAAAGPAGWSVAADSLVR